MICVMKYDIKQARLDYNLETGLYQGWGFSQYSPAYAKTNEDIREVLWNLNPQPNAHILTVAGSGDQALHYALSGAAHIDTFDITFNAKMMMDIKTTAIQKLERLDYLRLINAVARSRDMLSVPEYQQIEQFLPDDTRDYVRGMRGAHLVRSGSYFETLYNDEYAKLQKIVNRPFNFIWTDLADLGAHLTQEYDQIYLSNILQYHARPEFVAGLISGLARFVKPGGLIMVNVAPFFVGEDIEVARHLKQYAEKHGLGMVKLIYTHLYHMCVLQKR